MVLLSYPFVTPIIWLVPDVQELNINGQQECQDTWVAPRWLRCRNHHSTFCKNALTNLWGRNKRWLDHWTAKWCPRWAWCLIPQCHYLGFVESSSHHSSRVMEMKFQVTLYPTDMDNRILESQKSISCWWKQTAPLNCGLLGISCCVRDLRTPEAYRHSRESVGFLMRSPLHGAQCEALCAGIIVQKLQSLKKPTKGSKGLLAFPVSSKCSGFRKKKNYTASRKML